MIYRCHLCAGDAGPAHFRDPRALGPESFGSVVCSACRERCKAFTADEFAAIADEGACPECHRYDAHEGICAGPAEPCLAVGCGRCDAQGPGDGSPAHATAAGWVDHGLEGFPAWVCPACNRPEDCEALAEMLAVMLSPESSAEERAGLVEFVRLGHRTEVQSFRDADVQSRNAGFVLRMGDTEFHVMVTSIPRDGGPR